MVKKSDRKSNVSQTKPTVSVSPIGKFPTISPKEDLECRVLLDDQILLVDDFLSPAECKAFQNFVNELPMELTPPKKRGEAERVNYRFSVTSSEFAQKLHSLLVPHLPSFPSKGDPDRKPHSFNSNIRCYKYTPSQYFGPHYDDSVVDNSTGAKSEWTLLVYLTGVQDGVEGGETLFYKSERCRPNETIVAPLTRGTALLHRHGQDCLFHEGSEVTKGVKYVLRSDLMFK
ncbi:hypothetical protein K435DRAFT_731499 [Dendrothele bispora CBS 962.96]|uniref:Fe2OG dioxygenase domain-containing protein n=1 Tax=Dendrothele bispora (strain CBS 962.96) TaxID=1314807 RepID=A0A4S8LC65_DENBC|nr:hypothetical protein K435DRAFT_731499 [Dendrothele bispora CBS 962.96]